MVAEEIYHIPHPAARRFEVWLGRILGQRPCNGCSQPLGNEPRKFLNHRMYHPDCFNKLQSFAQADGQGLGPVSIGDNETRGG